MPKPEQIYNYFYRETCYSLKGFYPKPIKNWDNVYAKDDWHYFVSLSEKIAQSGNRIDYKLLIDSLIDFFKCGYIKPKLLISPKAIAIYKAHLKKLANESNPDEIKRQIIRSVKFIARFCKANGLNSFSDYFCHNINTFPTIVSHYQSGAIASCLFELIPNLDKKLHAFPADIVHDYFSDSNFESIRVLHINRSNWIKTFANNFEAIIDKAIKL